MNQKSVLFLFALFFSSCCFSADNDVDLNQNQPASTIQYKDNSADADLGKMVKVISLLFLFLLIAMVGLYFLKPFITRSIVKGHLSEEGKIKLNEIKHMPHNVIAYHLDVEGSSVLLVKNGSSISTLELGLSSQSKKA